MTFKFIVRGSLIDFGPGGRNPADLPDLPDDQAKLYDEAFILMDEDTKEPLANLRYRIKKADGSIEEGITDENGQTHITTGTAAEAAYIEIIRGA